MSNQTTSASATRRTKTKVKPIKNQPALGLFIEECQKAGIFTNLSKISDGKNKTNKQMAKTTNWLQYQSRREEEKESSDPSNLTDKGYLEHDGNRPATRVKKHGTENYCYPKE